MGRRRRPPYPWRSCPGLCASGVIAWLEHGYRHIDTAKIYGNEQDVGEAVRASGLPREEVFITTKLWNTDQGYDITLCAIDGSLERLGLDYPESFMNEENILF
ncbi:hypothetical protein GF324_10745 [bacterium]|nr:hypothetical protein [bacterium]